MGGEPGDRYAEALGDNASESLGSWLEEEQDEEEGSRQHLEEDEEQEQEQQLLGGGQDEEVEIESEGSYLGLDDGGDGGDVWNASEDESTPFVWPLGRAWSVIKTADSMLEQRTVVHINHETVSAVPQWGVFDGGLLDLPDGGGGEVEFRLEEIENGQWKKGLYVDALVLEQVL